MGDFLLLDLETQIDPIVHHFVNRPKPWEPGWRGADRFAAQYRDAFVQSPWPELAPVAPAAGTPSAALAPDAKCSFRHRLANYLRTVRFADGWKLAS